MTTVIKWRQLQSSRDWKENCVGWLHLYIIRQGLGPKHLWHCWVCWVQGAKLGGGQLLGWAGRLALWRGQRSRLTGEEGKQLGGLVPTIQKSLFRQGRSGSVGELSGACAPREKGGATGWCLL